MGGTRTHRRQKILGLMAVAAFSLTATGVAAAAAPGTSAGTGHLPHVKNPVGTYEWFQGGSDDGQITLASNHTWTAALFSDTGTWLTSGTTIALSDTGGGPIGGTLLAKVTKHGLSTVKKPGTYVYSGGTSGTWYAVKL